MSSPAMRCAASIRFTGRGITVSAPRRWRWATCSRAKSRVTSAAVSSNVRPALSTVRGRRRSVTTCGCLKPAGRAAPSVAINAYVARLHRAAHTDGELSQRFMRVANLLDEPPALFAPRVVWRTLRPRRHPGSRLPSLDSTALVAARHCAAFDGRAVRRRALDAVAYGCRQRDGETEPLARAAQPGYCRP